MGIDERLECLVSLAEVHDRQIASNGQQISELREIL